MPLIYVTGIETAGKTTVCNGLKTRGYKAYDIDEGIAHYYDKDTGKQSEWLPSPELSTQEWYKQNLNLYPHLQDKTCHSYRPTPDRRDYHIV